MNQSRISAGRAGGPALADKLNFCIIAHIDDGRSTLADRPCYAAQASAGLASRRVA